MPPPLGDGSDQNNNHRGNLNSFLNLKMIKGSKLQGTNKLENKCFAYHTTNKKIKDI